MAGSKKHRRAVVTGMGVVAPNGNCVDEFWASLIAGRSGIGPLDPLGPEHLQGNIHIPLAGHIRGFDPKKRLAHINRDKVLPHAERYSWLAAAAADEAVRQAGLAIPAAEPDRVAVIVGSALGGQSTIELAFSDHHLRHMKATHPLVLVRGLASSAAAHIGIEYCARGPVVGMCSACASADHSIALGLGYIRQDVADIAIVGGAESPLTYGMVLAMQSMGLLTHHACRPFSANRSGTVIAEAAGILVLEAEEHARARGARVLAEVLGSGLTASARDISDHEPGAVAHAIADALADAGLSCDEIDYLNAFGIGTVATDACEVQAIKSAFPGRCRRLSISATKPIHGYAMGATGALEAVACIKAIHSDFIPPTIGLDLPDAACDLEFTPITGQARDVEHAMSITMALGGLNTALVFGPPTDLV